MTSRNRGHNFFLQQDNKEVCKITFLQDTNIVRTAPFFSTLRKNDWSPRFHWEPSLERTADTINRPHEDYPNRTIATKEAIKSTEHALASNPHITLKLLSQIHKQVFPDHGQEAGQWRNVNVRVADHLAPRWEWMNKLMAELEFLYLDLELDQDNLRKWYFDFNTIHPLKDGNGRTGGIVVAAASQLKYGIYLTPGD